MVHLAPRRRPPAFVERVGVASSLVVAAVVAIALAAPTVLERWAPVLLVSGFVLGLPHGAVDHLVPFWLRGRPVTVWLMATLLASVLHFGASDLMTTPHATSQRLRPVARQGIHVLARGGPILAGPLLFWPDATAAALSRLDPATSTTLHALTWPIAAVALGCVTTDVVLALRDHDVRSATDTVLIVALFTLAPPSAAFGVYFGAWHGARHTARLIESDPRNRIDLTHDRYAAPFLRFLRSAATPTLIALGTVTALVLVSARQTGLTRPMFLLLFALTVPHMLIVALMDRSTSPSPLPARTQP